MGICKGIRIECPNLYELDAERDCRARICGAYRKTGAKRRERRDRLCSGRGSPDKPGNSGGTGRDKDPAAGGGNAGRADIGRTGAGVSHDGRFGKDKDIYPSRLYGHEERGEGTYGYRAGADGRRPVERECLFVLQQGEEAFEGGMVGQDGILVKREAVRRRQVSMAPDGGGGEGNKRGRIEDAAVGDRFF